MERDQALLLDVMRRYLQRRATIEPWEGTAGVSHLEIQKLMYFVNAVEPGLGLDFTPHRYGPYSENVWRLLAGMEGIYTHGFRAEDALSLEPIAVTDRGIEALDGFMQSDAAAPRIRAIVDAVLAMIDGFEGPYGVELLASTHWVATQQDAREPAAAAAAVRGWTGRKGRIYTDARIGVALARVLQSVGGQS